MCIKSLDAPAANLCALHLSGSWIVAESNASKPEARLPSPADERSGKCAICIAGHLAGQWILTREDAPVFGTLPEH